uniref:riboflavin kinase n=1 Tax=Chaetoceros debilis TaxID=122233 RepID=A0A7S3Q9G1_9STRA|mmetsp:Transcript_1781/g.2546  ORF Transcript_1781/g.2546 Transcript_1781/m.2546 type:complete len:526 (+) Transcript_1781:120-1697(+)
MKHLSAMFLSKLTVFTLFVVPYAPDVIAFTGLNRLPRRNFLQQSSSSSFDDEFVEMQKTVGEKSESENDIESESGEQNIKEHLEHQKEVFDEMSSFFNSEDATPEEVKPVLQYLAKQALYQMKGESERSSGSFDVLDVGCGTGALFPYYLEAADELEMKLNIVGLDLSQKMIDCANDNVKNLLSDDSKHSIRCEVGDYVSKIMGVNLCKETMSGFENGVINEDTETFRESFDGVVINACFGNFLDQDSVVTAAANSLKEDGCFIISHPLGAGFVEKLKSENPSTVPNLLPSQTEFDELLQFQPLRRENFMEEAQLSENAESATALYFASAKKIPHLLTREVLRLRGKVDTGFGRGGKKLGVPTANLPSSLFQNALENVPTGVYFGWALIKGDDQSSKGRDVIHKAVVNVGYSPTFDGEENKEKIVEAHLIVGDDDIEGDFYGETMKLGLCGFLRSERKFASFPDLIAAINRDVNNAKSSLDLAPYSTFCSDSFFQHSSEEMWVGSSGGDENASYEFEASAFLEDA